MREHRQASVQPDIPQIMRSPGVLLPRPQDHSPISASAGDLIRAPTFLSANPYVIIFGLRLFV